MEKPDVPREIGQAWENVSRILLAKSIGPLCDYRRYLQRHVDGVVVRKSRISGKDVIVSSERLPDGARFVSYDEIGDYMKIFGSEKFDINELKDLDSCIGALKERVHYVGNVVLGNSKNVVESNRCINSSDVYRSQDVYDSKHVAYSSFVKSSEHIFGSDLAGVESMFCIKVFETFRATRCMESVRIYAASDCYFTGNLEQCADCLFTFNQRNKRNLVGNMQFGKDAFSKLKAKLMEDVRTTLESKKEIPSIIDIIGDGHG